MKVNPNVEQLQQRCDTKIPERFPQILASAAAERLQQELAIAARLGHAERFAAMMEIGQFAQNNGVPCRLIGSGCSSIIAYLLGLTEVNPISFELLLERFLDPQGRWNPWFMLEIAKDRRQEVLDFAQKHFGREIELPEVSLPEMPDAAEIPYRVAQRIRQEVKPNFTLGRIWRMCHFHEDRRVFPLLYEGDIDGVYWLEQVDFRDDVRRLKPGAVQCIAAMMAMRIIRQQLGDSLEASTEWTAEIGLPPDDCRKLASFLSDTSGLVIYQEQVMVVMSWLGKMELSDCYRFILAASKNKRSQVDEYRQQFVQNAVERIDEKLVTNLFQRLQDAAQYSCCKSHHIAQAMTTYHAVFLKYHYPDQFHRVLQEVRARQQGEHHGQKTHCEESS